MKIGRKKETDQRSEIEREISSTCRADVLSRREVVRAEVRKDPRNLLCFLYCGVGELIYRPLVLADVSIKQK